MIFLEYACVESMWRLALFDPSSEELFPRVIPQMVEKITDGLDVNSVVHCGLFSSSRTSCMHA